MSVGPKKSGGRIAPKAYFVPPVKITREWMRTKNGAIFVKRVMRQNHSPPILRNYVLPVVVQVIEKAIIPVGMN